MGRRKFGSYRQLPSGLWQARFIGTDGERYTGPNLFLTAKAADRYLAKEQTAISDGKWKPPTKDPAPTLFGDYAELYLKTRSLRPSTMRCYRRYLDVAILPTFGKTKVTGITRPKVKAWYGNLNPETPTWRKHCYDLLRAILKDAEDAELIDRNPCYIRGASTVKPARKVKTATPEQVDALAAAMPAQLQAAVYLGAWCSQRLGEILALQRQHIVIIGPESAYVDVSENKTTGPDSKPFVGPPKTDAGERHTAIPPHIIPRIQAHLDHCVAPGDEALLFPSRLGGYLSENTFRRRYNNARETAKMPSFTFHDLRHTGNTWAGQAGATIAELAARAGHDDQETVARYQHGTTERDQQLARRMSEVTGWRPAVKDGAP